MEASDFERGYELGFSEGYEKAVYFLINNPTSFERIRKNQYSRDWQIA